MKLYSALPILPEWKIPLFDIKKGIEIEPEFGALLYALVRLHKPRICVETGTYIGDSAEWIGKALRDNGTGSLVTCDTNEEYVKAAQLRFKDLPIEVRLEDGKTLLGRYSSMDFVHLDGGDPSVREQQIAILGDHNISPGGLITWHDAVEWCPKMYEQFAGSHDWPHLILPTPVGVAIFQRPA